jgi:hypothetical protein
MYFFSKPEWLNPGLITDVIWDYNMCLDGNLMGIVKELIGKAQ